MRVQGNHLSIYFSAYSTVAWAFLQKASINHASNKRGCIIGVNKNWKCRYRYHNTTAAVASQRPANVDKALLKQAIAHAYRYVAKTKTAERRGEIVLILDCSKKKDDNKLEKYKLATPRQANLLHTRLIPRHFTHYVALDRQTDGSAQVFRSHHSIIQQSYVLSCNSWSCL